jgi:uncharacterized protein (DUF58 family)
MRRSATPKLHAYVAVVALALTAAFVARRPEMVLVAAPFAVLLALALPTAGQVARVEVSVRWPRERVIEGETLALCVTVRADRPLELLHIAIDLPDGLALPVGEATAARIGPAERREVTFPVTCRHWGAYSRAECRLTSRSAHGLFREDGRVAVRYGLRVYPATEHLRELVLPRETQPSAGNIVARGAGAGIEFAELRPFQPGDELRQVNWRATARRGEMWVNARRPERNADVIIFLDTFADVGTPQRGTLDLSVRAATALAARYLRDRDRVGVIGFGGTLQWLLPGSGQRQLYQIVESLIATQLSLSYAWKDVSFIPPHTLPPQALVIALTPLVDERTTQALVDLLRRGFDTAILEISPDVFLRGPTDRTSHLARRVWSLERQLLRDRYRHLGGAVATWSGERPLETAIEEVARFRRHARVASSF